LVQADIITRILMNQRIYLMSRVTYMM